MATVNRIHHERNTFRGHPTLVQRFLFSGDGASATAVAGLLEAAPLVGPASLFGSRPGSEESAATGERRLCGFSPVPGFRFDVAMRRHEGNRFLVRISQDERTSPYLEGDLLWRIDDATEGVVFEEQINTQVALDNDAELLTGAPRSLRRWLFFRLGHERVMWDLTANLAALL